MKLAYVLTALAFAMGWSMDDQHMEEKRARFYSSLETFAPQDRHGVLSYDLDGDSMLHNAVIFKDPAAFKRIMDAILSVEGMYGTFFVNPPNTMDQKTPLDLAADQEVEKDAVMSNLQTPVERSDPSVAGISILEDILPIMKDAGVMYHDFVDYPGSAKQLIRAALTPDAPKPKQKNSWSKLKSAGTRLTGIRRNTHANSAPAPSLHGHQSIKNILEDDAPNEGIRALFTRIMADIRAMRRTNNDYEFPQYAEPRRGRRTAAEEAFIRDLQSSDSDTSPDSSPERGPYIPAARQYFGRDGGGKLDPKEEKHSDKEQVGPLNSGTAGYASFNAQPDPWVGKSSVTIPSSSTTTVDPPTTTATESKSRGFNLFGGKKDSKVEDTKVDAPAARPKMPTLNLGLPKLKSASDRVIGTSKSGAKSTSQGFDPMNVPKPDVLRSVSERKVEAVPQEEKFDVTKLRQNLRHVERPVPENTDMSMPDYAPPPVPGLRHNPPPEEISTTESTESTVDPSELPLAERRKLFDKTK